MSTKNITDFLKKIELFSELNANEIEIIAEKFETITFKKGDFLFKENNERKNIFIIYSGKVELIKSTPFGEEKRLVIFQEYDFMGEGSLLDNSPHSTTARAIEDTVTFSLDIIKNKDFLEENQLISLKTLKYLSKMIMRRMGNANSRLMNIGEQYISGRTRSEHDLLGDRDVPEEMLYGVQTLRAIENFNISGITLNFFPNLIVGFAYIKKAAAIANNKLKLLPDDISEAICKACDEIINGRWHKHFMVDMIQGGAGTSTNMNANEVIANRALEILGHKRGDYQYCHPNNHVNLSQSTNDAYPSAVHLAIFLSNKNLVQRLESLIESLKTKANQFEHILKMGRTQLQDAVPMSLGQSFGAYASTLEEEIARLNYNADTFLEVNMGATAIGTGICSVPEYKYFVVYTLKEITGLDIRLADNLVEATQDTSAFVMYSSALKHLAIKLSKISNDLRLLSSGPRAGFNEINLPPMQPGSSIMPGKVNPVIPEVVNQIAFKVIGNDLTVSMASEAGQLELNVMEPVIVQSISESIEMLKNGMDTLKYKCIDGITANEKTCHDYVINSIGLVTALNPYIGYEKSTIVAKEALETNRGVYELVLEKGFLSKEQLDEILKPENMIKPQKINII
ncbi:MAG: aspartate ammonia-lyase [Bacteroidales bacterium]|nr:aspartate ammonia-lyase [Bacteroidales bacterium]